MKSSPKWPLFLVFFCKLYGMWKSHIVDIYSPTHLASACFPYQKLDTEAVLTLCLAGYNATVRGWSLYFRLPTENCDATGPRGRQSSTRCRFTPWLWQLKPCLRDKHWLKTVALHDWLSIDFPFIKHTFVSSLPTMHLCGTTICNRSMIACQHPVASMPHHTHGRGHL